MYESASTLCLRFNDKIKHILTLHPTDKNKKFKRKKIHDNNEDTAYSSSYLECFQSLHAANYTWN